jgi:hypothetical protein
MDGADIAGAAPGEEEGAPPSPPTPVRSAMAAPPSPEAARQASGGVVLEADGIRWAVRVLGRSSSGSASAAAPLLLLGFFHPEDAALPTREALVVARALAQLTELQLDAAWRTGQPPQPPGTRKPIFPEITAKGGKDG